ncbi:hypothetical protein B6S44_21620 [Bosea sp. Tri-44]|uniref:PfkB family carbohydrate kinase n=1 Tax=Bosea sp. Tri-44 TaxID=1972137 RepID=UPI00100FD4D4|nr:PfkB family carbohydrate kinase [Bosea sp. Tri-44]RXT51206.1 hypothetical protein B6S44_21620 [Bosea sp. Tri-44]
MFHVIGGSYREICISPEIKQFYGSGGRAATALAGLTDVTLHTFVSDMRLDDARRMAVLGGFQLDLVKSDIDVSFGYIHPLASSQTDPLRGTFERVGSIHVDAGNETALVFGMYEGNSSVRAQTIIYDPQDGQMPVSYLESGCVATERLAILMNAGEALKTTGAPAVEEAGALLLAENSADVVIVKSGPKGALVFQNGTPEIRSVPAFNAKAMFGIGSGDMFAAAFAYHWGERGESPFDAAEKASRAVSHYVETRNDRLSLDDAEGLTRQAVTVVPGRVYLAGPFFTMAQRWLVEETREQFLQMGLEVFSPVHEVGRGPADFVAPADLRGLETCDRVFAVLDGYDSGTMFEIGYARKMGIPVYGYGELIAPEDSKMITGSGCRLIHDFATAVYHTAWRL